MGTCSGFDGWGGLSGPRAGGSGARLLHQRRLGRRRIRRRRRRGRSILHRLESACEAAGEFACAVERLRHSTEIQRVFKGGKMKGLSRASFPERKSWFSNVEFLFLSSFEEERAVSTLFVLSPVKTDPAPLFLSHLLHFSISFSVFFCLSLVILCIYKKIGMKQRQRGAGKEGEKKADFSCLFGWSRSKKSLSQNCLFLVALLFSPPFLPISLFSLSSSPYWHDETKKYRNQLKRNKRTVDCFL